MRITQNLNSYSYNKPQNLNTKQNKPAFGAVIFDKLPEKAALISIIKDKATYSFLANRLEHISNIANGHAGLKTGKVLKDISTYLNDTILQGEARATTIANEITMSRNGRQVEPNPLFIKKS